MINFESVTLEDVKRLKAQDLLERKHKDPTIVPTIDFNNWPKTMDLLDQWVKGHCGMDNSLLGYVIRKPANLFPPAAANDPPMGANNSIYKSHDKEIVARHQIIFQAWATKTLKHHKKDGPFCDV